MDLYDINSISEEGVGHQSNQRREIWFKTATERDLFDIRLLVIEADTLKQSLDAMSHDADQRWDVEKMLRKSKEVLAYRLNRLAGVSYAKA